MVKHKKQAVWLSRDDSESGRIDVHLTDDKPLPLDNTGIFGGDLTMCAGDFFEATGFYLRKGRVARVFVTIEPAKDD